MNRKQAQKLVNKLVRCTQRHALQRWGYDEDDFEVEREFKKVKKEVVDAIEGNKFDWSNFCPMEADLCIGICPKCHSWSDCKIHDKDNWICKKCDIIFSKVYFPSVE